MVIDFESNNKTISEKGKYSESLACTGKLVLNYNSKKYIWNQNYWRSSKMHSYRSNVLKYLLEKNKHVKQSFKTYRNMCVYSMHVSYSGGSRIWPEGGGVDFFNGGVGVENIMECVKCLRLKYM